MAIDFSVNPCRRSIFDVFRLDKGETAIPAILRAVADAKERLKFGRNRSSDGTDLELTEAQLNNLQERLFDPLARLKEEQIVHQTHLFAQDEELARGIAALEERDDGLKDALAQAQEASLRVVGRLLPPPDCSRIEDDLPWPELPAPLALRREALDDAILRDQ
ncbi:MAG TPA: hypothetical protein VNO14_09090 [Blastocatellia bacterium]|nr:hypothetical protein [Blastocatellia bacterium]